MALKSFASVFGSLLTGISLVVCFILGNSVVTSDENAIGFGSLLILITAPWSFWLAKLIIPFDENFLWIIMPSALINALLLYFVGLPITRFVRALKAKSKAPLV
jgi:hypothetical protein